MWLASIDSWTKLFLNWLITSTTRCDSLATQGFFWNQTIDLHKSHSVFTLTNIPFYYSHWGVWFIDNLSWLGHHGISLWHNLSANPSEPIITHPGPTGTKLEEVYHSILQLDVSNTPSKFFHYTPVQQASRGETRIREVLDTPHLPI